jgi:death-on-curing protein
VTEYLELEDVLGVVDRIVGRDAVRDIGLLDSSVHRPSTNVFGHEAYPELMVKAAALLHSLARNHALLDGNKRTAWVCMRAMLRLNGQDLRAPVDAAEVFVNAVARGDLEVPEIAKQLSEWAAGS